MKNSTHVPSIEIVLGFKALSEPLRMQVFELLKEQEMCVCDLCEHLNVAQSKLSFHLKTMREAQLITARQEGRWVYYRLNLAKIVMLEQYLSEFRRFSPMLPARVCPPNS